ncbi:MAG: hypothetical protein AAF602_10575 [Myxococcota bacterium]
MTPLSAAALTLGWLVPAPLHAAPYLDGTASLGLGSPGFVAVDAPDGRLYITDITLGGVHVLNADLEPERFIATGGSPFGIAIDARTGSRRIFVGDFGAGTVKVVDVSSDTVLCTVGVGPGAAGMAFDPTTERLFVGVEGPKHVAILGGVDTCSPLGTVVVGDKPNQTTVDSHAGRVYVSVHHANQVAVLDAASGAVLTNIPAGPGDPTDVAHNPTTGDVLVGYSIAGAVSSLDTGPLGEGPYTRSDIGFVPQPRHLDVDPTADLTWVMSRAFPGVYSLGNGVLGGPVGVPSAFLSDVGADPYDHCAFVVARSPAAVYRVCDDAVVIPAVIDPSAQVAGNATIGHGTVIEAGARVHQRVDLGRYVRIGQSAVVGHDASVGDRSTLADGAVLRDRVQLGSHVEVGEDTTVGHDSAVGDGTRIGADTRIGDRASIGTNVEIGDDVVVGHDARIDDGAVVGDRVRLQDRVHIGAGAIIGADALLRHDVVVPPGAVVPPGTTLP